MNPAPVPFKELLAGATKGEWKVCTYRPFRIIPRSPSESTYEYGDDAFNPVCDMYGALSEMKSNAAYIARCNPATMAVVWEALIATRNYGIEKNLATPTVDRAIALLNGTAGEEKK